MNVKTQSFVELLGGSVQYVVPVYQRLYSWEKQHCDQLWRDITRIGSSNDERALHFVGSVVYVPDAHRSSSSNRRILIDGQQRITTITLLILAMKEILGDRRIGEQSLAAYLYNSRGKGKDRYKVLLSKGDKDTLLHLLDNSNPDPQTESKLTKNFEHFKSLIRSVDKDDGLKTVWDGIKRLRVIKMDLEDDDNPQLIFESMNSTGKDLSQADLIRNYVFMDIDLEEQNRLYEKYWYPMEMGFGDKYDRDFDIFVRYFLSIEIKKIPKIEDVYTDFKASYSIKQDGGNIEEILEKMLRYSDYYRRIALGKEEDHKLKRVFQELDSDLKAHVSFPFILKLYDHYERGRLDKSDFEEIVSLTISYIFRRYICGLPTNQLRTVFIKLVDEVDEGVSVSGIKSSFAKLSGQARFPDDEEFLRYLKTVHIYESNSCDYLLDRLENLDRKEKVNRESYKKWRIMPKAGDLGDNDKWKEELGEEAVFICDEYASTLGNITLVGRGVKNKALPFIEQRDMRGGFADSCLRLNSYIKNCGSWNENTIKERAELLAKSALRIWKCHSQELSKFIYPYEYGVDYHFMNRNDREVYECLRSEIFKLGGISERCKKAGISHYFGGEKLIEVLPRADHLRISFYADISRLDDPKSRVIHVEKGRGKENARLILRSMDDIPYIVEIVKQVLLQKQSRRGSPSGRY